MTLKDLTVLDSEPRLGAEFCFNLYDGKKAILLAAGSHAEKVFWMDDIVEAAQVSTKLYTTFYVQYCICTSLPIIYSITYNH